MQHITSLSGPSLEILNNEESAHACGKHFSIPSFHPFIMQNSQNVNLPYHE